MESVEFDLNIGAVALYSIYILFGFYLLIIVFQRITYTLSSPLPLTIMRFILLLMILIWCIFNNGLYLYSCFIHPTIALNNIYYKIGFYIEFYFNNILWSLSVMCLAQDIKFKRIYNISHTLFDGGKRAQSVSVIDGKRYSSIDNDCMAPYDRDAPPPNSINHRQQRKLDVNDVDLRIDPKEKHKKKKDKNKNNSKDKPKIKTKEQQEQKHNNNNDRKYEQDLNRARSRSPKWDAINSKSSKDNSITRSFTLAAETVYDNTKERQNQIFFIIDFYLIGFGSLLFNIIWYIMHPQYLDQFEFKQNYNMPRWSFPFDHHINNTLILFDRAIMSIWLMFMSFYLLKEFYNYKTFPIIFINLFLYWLLFGLLNNDYWIFIQPFFFYILFFSCHISDCDRDEQPASKSVSVNVDQLELFYTLWPAKPYNSIIPPNVFCFGPSPRIQNPLKSSIILLPGWGNIKEDYNYISYLLSKYERNVIVIDYRGVGETGLGPENNHDFYTSDQYADDIIDLIKQLFPHPMDDDDDDDDDDESSEEEEQQDEKNALNKEKQRRLDEIKGKKKEQKKEEKKLKNNQKKNGRNNNINSHKVFLIGLSMGGNVAMQCALHADAAKYIRGIAVCSGHGGAYLLKKGPDFEFYGNQIVTGNALHYGYCQAQRQYIEYAHSKTYRQSLINRCNLRLFYSWRLSTHPYYCCNCSKYEDVRDKSRKLKARNKKNNNNNRSHDDDEPPSVIRGVSKWFESKLSLNLRGGISDKHAIVEGIERQSDIAEEGFNIANIVNNINIPTLIYYGENDTIIDKQTAELLKITIGDNAWKEGFINGGHNFWFENPNEFIKTILDWMDAEEDFDLGSGARSSNLL